MAFRTSAEYLAAIRQQRRSSTSAASGSLTASTYERFAPTRHCWGTWIYDCVQDPRSSGRSPRIVSIDAEPCHPFWSFPRRKEDLLDNILVARRVSRVSPAAGYATIGRDELAALYVAASAMARQGQGEYLDRVRAYVRRFQREQLMTLAAITDPKGDRRLRPADQPNREAYLRVVDAGRTGSWSGAARCTPRGASPPRS